MKGWKECKLSDAVKFGNGKVRPNSDGTIPVYGGNGILGFGNESNYKDETIVIGRVGAYCGAVYFENKPIWVSDNALSAKPTDISDAKFIFYYLKNLGLNQFAEGSSHPLVTQTLLNSIDIIIPSTLPEQKAIAAVLSSLDDKIDLLHRQNKTLEAMAETLFRQWFVEEAYEEWEEGVLGDLVSVKYGKDHKKLTDGLIPVYGSGGIMRYADTSLYAAESVLIPRKGTLNNIIYIDEPFWTVDTMFYTEMKKPNIAKFIYHFVKDIDFAGMNVGSAVPSMTTEVLNNLPINIPPYSLIQEFNNVVNDLYKKKEANTIQIRTLEKLRDTLLPKLMAGEVRVDYKKEAAGEY